MDQDFTVKRLMLLIKEDDQVPPEFQGFVRKYLNYSFAAGFDFGRRSYVTNTKRQHTKIGKYNEFDTLIEDYKSVADAARKNKTCTDTLFNAMKSHKKAIGFYWKRLQ